jgi:type II secretory pathway pseudopilin PulG
MALALALAVVMGILLLKAGPNLVAETQRENEAELVFRGEAIAGALRVYFAKTGKYPTDLDEVMKLRPRILRQKYKDPMTASGDWELITQVQPGASGNTQGLPIVGVRSRSEKDSIRIYQNKTLVHDWLFTADQNLLGVGGTVTENERTKSLLKSGATPTAPVAPKP